MNRFHAEDGPEDTSAYPGGCVPCGMNGSFKPYVHPDHKGAPPPPSVRDRLADLRLRFAVQGAARPRA